MIIRTEIPSDIMKIDQLLESSFSRRLEADFIHALREQGLLTLGLVVADDEGAILGYISFSPVNIVNHGWQWQSIAIVIVLEHYRHQKLGSQLVKEGINILRDFGSKTVVVYGHPAFYHKLGFKQAAEYGLFCSWPNTETALHIYSSEPRILAMTDGLIEFAEPFNKVHEMF